MQDRIKPFKSIHNFRDFGGYETIGGGRLKRDKLFRSAHLNNLNEGDLAAIGDLGVKLVVDLRHKPERERQPSLYPVADEAKVLEFGDLPESESAKIAPHEAFMEHDLETPEDAHDYMVRSYAQRPRDDRFQEICRETFTHMIETGDEILVHCAAGKDRTGTIVALIQGVLGLSDQDIRKDYMLTNTAIDIEAFLVPASAMFAKRYNRPITPEALRPMFGVTEAYLESSLSVIGDIPTYVRDVIGISEADITVLKQRYTD